MNLNFVATSIYTAILAWIYSKDISFFWRYMRFEGEFSGSVVLRLIVGSAIITAMLPSNRDARSYLLTCLHYLLFIPSLVYISFNDVQIDYYLAFAICTFVVYLGSAVNVRSIKSRSIKLPVLFIGLQSLILSALALNIAFGGLNTFNMDLESVYEFRTEAASNLPEIFGYFYSNVSNTLIPAFLILATISKNWYFVTVGIASSFLLFGMAHHKSILFTILMVFVLFLILNRYKTPKILSFFFISVVAVCSLELIWIQFIQQIEVPGIVSSYIIRRSLLVPPMLDASYIELFYNAPKYFWSTSRLTLGTLHNPYDIAAPFLVGKELFGDINMSANAGLIGSGYSNAGLFGTFIYSTFMAATISFINTAGKKVNPELIAVLSLPTIWVIFTSTDLTTALITHGLLILLILILILPKYSPSSPSTAHVCKEVMK